MLRARQRLDKYKIEGRIASGPLADVYRAYDSIHRQRVALKIPRAGDLVSDEEFMHEVKVAVKLRHPNILSVINASYIDDNFVIAMELGLESLGDRIERRMSTARAMDLSGQALAAVAFAHEQKIIHCDIKPENFILFDNNRLKLTDFGFAKLSLRTIKASGSGTIDYIAPEQAMGRPMFQSDVFSLGLVIYRLLSGKLPEWPFEWPLEGFDRLRTRVRPEMIDILKKAIQLDPKDRFRDAMQMHAAFDSLQLQARRQKAASSGKSAGSSRPESAWRDFQREFKQQLQTRHRCRRCEGPVSESMQACPWCGIDSPTQGTTSDFASSCPRCERGVKNDWDYCSWCYGPGFEPETSRRYPDKRYTAKCENPDCGGLLMPFMRYCPWCRRKVKHKWKLKRTRDKCTACGWGVSRKYWKFCAWCREPLR